ncbi:MAG: DUF1573 domain-containing protein [Candidatus Cloacimonetes bacterium]|nr:DUF1573 domain-containing protein [Candidatus Cloacimonadota bacterium]
MKPGQTGTISVQFDSNNRPGDFHKSMLIYTDINDQFIRLIIEGYVISTPGKFRNKIGSLDASNNIIDFGDIFFGTTKNETITIFNSTGETVHIISLTKFDQIELNVEPQILKPGQSGEITAEFSTLHSEMGKFITVYDFEIIKKEEKYNGKLSIIANIVEDFSILTEWESANPPIISTAFNKIDLGKIEPNKLTIKNLEIENLGKRELLIHNITTTNSMYSIHPYKQKIKPGEKGTFQLSIKPTIKKNNIASKLTIISNDPVKSVINFTIIGKVDLP